MATTIMHAELVTQKFPYNFSELSSTVVMNRGLETQRGVPGGFQGAEAAQSYGIPQAYYMENVVPIARGFTSVAYTQVIESFPGSEPVLEAFEIRAAPAGLAILIITETKQYLYDANIKTWQELSVPTYDPGKTTVASVKGVSYIFIVGSGIYNYNFITKVLDPCVGIGLDVGAIVGIFSAGSVLGAWTADNRVLWSSIYNPLDFVPSLSTGAGSSSVLAVSSQIVTILSLGEDFIIYTATNAVAGRQTGNVQFPFNFAEVVGSAGVSHAYHVANNSNAGVHISYSASGFQQVSVQEAQYIWPELAEGIQRGIRVTLNPLMLRPQFETTFGVDVRLQFASNKYVVISLRNKNLSSGNTPYTEAYVFDSQLNRWGRIVAEHACILEYTLQVTLGLYTYDELEADYLTYADLDSVPIPPLSYRMIDSAPLPVAAIPGANFGIVGIDAKVHIMAPTQTADFRGDNVGIVASTPRIFLGKYKVYREQGLIVQGLRVNKLIAAGIVAHGHGVDGSYIRQVTNFKENLSQPGHWLERIAADSVSIEFFGSFVLTDLAIECEGAGHSNQFAVPARKKFYSYINSAPYPVYVTDTITFSGAAVSGTLVETYWVDSLSMFGAPAGDGDLHDTTQFHTVYDPHYFTLDGTPQSGTLAITIANIFYTMYDLENFDTAGSPQSGTLVVTYFPVFHTLYDVDKFDTSGTPISGTLV